MGNFEMLCAICMSLGVMIVGLLRVNERWKLQKNGLRTIGHVVRIDKLMFRNRMSFVTIIVFTTIEGHEINIKHSDPCSYNVNDQAPIIYDRNDPENIVIVSKIMALFDIIIATGGLTALLFFLIKFLK